ncbi:MAG TPA: ribonuclease P protein component [Oscillospiraceae bacterium]|nr:ribonuclease P protein component [Oscillospiraceae bacterium]
MNDFVTLKRNCDFRRIYARGKSAVSPALVVYYMKNYTKGNRVGFTTSKKIGNAVVRNRARRVLKEGLRSVMPDIKTGYDFVLVARNKTKYLKSTDIAATLAVLLKDKGLILPVKE